MIISKKGFLQAAFEGNEKAIQDYIAANKNNPDNINTRVKYSSNFGISTSKRFSWSGFKGFLYQHFYYSTFNYYHDQHSISTNHLLFHYVKIPSNVNMFTWNYRYGMTALSIAAELGYTTMVYDLLQVDGIDVNAADSNDCTPLMLAAMYGHTQIVKMLLEIPEVNLTKRQLRFQGKSALELAEAFKHPEIAAIIKRKIIERMGLKDSIEFPLEGTCKPRVITSNFQQRYEKANQHGVIPEEFTCPIALNGELMEDPVTLRSGITFDRQYLIYYFNYLQNPPTINCPVTGKVIFRAELCTPTNIVIKNMIEKFVADQEALRAASIAPSLRRQASFSNLLFFSESDSGSEVEYVGTDECSSDDDSLQTAEVIYIR